MRIVFGGNSDGDESTVLDLKEAIKLAKDQGLDLVEVGPNQSPPVCRILDYGKFKFSQAKKMIFLEFSHFWSYQIDVVNR